MRLSLSAKVLRSNEGAISRMIDRVRGMDDKRIFVGVPKGKMALGQNGHLVDISMIAAVMNYGSVSRNIPARPFIEPSINQNLQKYKRLMGHEAKGILVSNTKLHIALQHVGMVMAADVQDYMLSGSFKPLAAATIKAKGSSKPLIDTGQLRQAITYKVE
jgi:hypothetical protein